MDVSTQGSLRVGRGCHDDSFAAIVSGVVSLKDRWFSFGFGLENIVGI